jgi:hypothetical protein
MDGARRRGQALARRGLSLATDGPLAPSEQRGGVDVFWSKAFVRTAPDADPSPPEPLPAELTTCDPRVDAFVESYVDWREECRALEAAYARWERAERPGRDLAFAAYRAALDREEKAAHVFGLVAAGIEGLQRG